MRVVVAFVIAGGVASGLAGCAWRCGPCDPCAGGVAGGAAPSPGWGAPPAHVARADRLIEAAKEREPFLPMSSEADARTALKSVAKYPQVPNLMRIAALAPKSMDAEMKAWQTLQKETTLDAKLVNEVFYVVSSKNECGH